MLAVKKNLKDQTDGTVMYCPICGAEYSATAGDYWNRPDDYEFKCCGETMVLGTFRRVFFSADEIKTKEESVK